MKTNDLFASQNNEILAVISAVIASLETMHGHKLVVKSFRRIPQNSPVWNTTGRIERISKSINS